MLLPIYLFLASLCAAVVNKRLRIDPFLVILPCALLVIEDLTQLRGLFASLIPVALLFALVQVFLHRTQLQVEAITRLGAGLSLGGFIGVQLLFLLPMTFTVLITFLVVISLTQVLLLRIGGWPLSQIPAPLKLFAGMLMGTIQFVGLSSGLAWLQDKQSADLLGNRAALWAFSLVGALIGLIALPSEWAWQTLSISQLLAALLGGGAGLLLQQRLTSSAFESKVLDWIVLAMCLSVWGHLLLKHVIFSA